MPIYNITVTQIQDDAVGFKAAQLKKTKAQIFDDFVVGLISGWIREMLDADVKPIQEKWDSLTKTQKDQIKKIAEVQGDLRW